MTDESQSIEPAGGFPAKGSGQNHTTPWWPVRSSGLPRRTFLAGAAGVGVALASQRAAHATPRPADAAEDIPPVLPQPRSMERRDGEFQVSSRTRIVVRHGSPEATRVAEYLAQLMRPATGYRLPVVSRSGAGVDQAIVLDPDGPADLGRDGYTLTADSDEIRLHAHGAQGLFHAVQTLRQLLPAKVEASVRRDGPWPVPAVRITDSPRFSWRGAMLDVTRHFFAVDTVQRYIDLLAMYKVNILHLHLSDDQGWRIVIDSWPRLVLQPHLF